MTDRQRQMHEHLDRAAAGADLAPGERPGVPMEHQTRPLTPTAPDRIRSMTPVFGTAQPLHGVSGMLRRVAYSTRESRARHWMLLLFADRVNVLEHRIAKLVKIIAIVPVGAAALILAAKLLKD